MVAPVPRAGPEPSPALAFTIAPASAADAPLLLAIQKRAFALEGRLCDDFTIPPLAESLGDVAADMASATVLVARAGTTLVGSVRGRRRGDVCLVERLSIEPTLHGRGVGSALLRAIEDAHADASSFELQTNRAMAANVRFYTRHGYRIVASERRSPRITLVTMRKG